MSRRGDATRKTIVEAAARLLRSEGAALSMDAVARAAQISRQAVYLHFPSRTALMMAVVEHIGRASGGEALFRAADQAKGARAVLEQKLAAAVEYQGRIADVVEAFDVARHTDEVAAAAWEDRNQVRLEAIQKMVADLKRARLLAPGWTPGQVADALWALSSPRLQLDLTRGRAWKKRDVQRLLVALSRVFLKP
jgi:AcrR family transcriptional regulator